MVLELLFYFAVRLSFFVRETQDPLVPTDPLDLMANRAGPEQLEPKAWLVTQEQQELKERKENRVSEDHLDHKELRDHLECPERLVYQDLM